MITRPVQLSIVFIVLLSLVVNAAAQRSKVPKGPRAVAVLEWTPKGLVLVPISLMLDGRYYDASVYHATPTPMALEPGNVYEGQRSGEGTGDFTITNAEQWPNGAWVGRGNWSSNEEKQKQAEARAKAGAKPAEKPGEDEDPGPPKLTRGGQKSPETPPNLPPAPKTGAPPQQVQDTSNDPDRPVLRRGKPAGEQAAKAEESKELPKAPEGPPPGFQKVQAAVSDATNTESRPYAWKWANAEEGEKIRAGIQNLALAAVRDYATKVKGPKPGKLEDIDIRAFDLEYNNSADVVLSARARPSEISVRATGSKQGTGVPAPTDFEYYVTVVAREDIYAQLGKTFSAVTDNRHLDAFPRMQLIDAVDVDGNGGGDLLFRRTTDRGSAFVLYRVNSSRLDEILRVPEPQLD